MKKNILLYFNTKTTCKFLYLSLLLTFLCQCQNAKKAHCENNNWRQQGYLDALSGNKLEDFKSIQKACLEKFNVKIKQELYKEGFESGLVQLCQAPNAYRYGKQGNPYHGTCKELDEERFLKAFRQGRLDFLRAKYNTTVKKVQNAESRVWRKQNEYELESNTNPHAASEVYDVLESYRAELLRLQNEQDQIKASIEKLSQLITPKSK